MPERVVVALVRTGHFSTSVGSWVRWAGYGYTQVETRAGLIAVLRTSAPALVIVDLACEPGDLLEITGECGDARLVAFGSPRAAEALQAAEAAGFHEVLPDIVFHRQVPQMLSRNLPDDVSEELLQHREFETRRETDPERFGEAPTSPMRSLWRRIRR